jgi:hypothetical protein
MTSAVRASCGLYKMLLCMYPSDFRLRFGSEMVTTFADLIRYEWEHEGLPGVARVWRSAWGSVFRRHATPTAKLNCDFDLAVVPLLLCLICNDLSCDDDVCDSK